MSTFDWIGLDFGGQKGDTTAICYCDSGLKFFQSNKKVDTDLWIENWLKEHRNIKNIFIDAPLSLPAAYFNEGTDFMYREADRQVNAMSPMFLGGLTARAIRLKNHLEQKDIRLIETYPAQLEKILFESKSPKKQKWDASRLDFLQKLLEIEIAEPVNRHQYDALLAWVSAWRYEKGISVKFGKTKEGVIHV